MPFANYENSHDEGRPIAFYRFILPKSDSSEDPPTEWRYTSADRDLLVGGDLWKSVPISDDGVKQKGDAASDVLQITAPYSIGPVQTHIGTPPSRLIQVHIFWKHIDDSEMRAIYVGEVTQIGFARPGQAVISCEALSASMQRDGLRLGWQRTCPYALYDPVTCKVNKAGHAYPAAVTAVSGFVVTVSGLSEADGFFNGGFIEWSHPVRGIEYRAIESHVGNALTMFGMTDDIFVGLQITAYPGCSRTTSDCEVKFNNLLNYGGIPHMPGVSPFDGNPVF